MKEDKSWSSVGSDEAKLISMEVIASPENLKEKNDGADDDVSLETLKKELAEKDKLFERLKNQVQDLTSEAAVKDERINDLSKKQELSVKILQATLQTETFLDKIDSYTPEDVLSTIGTLVAGSETLQVVELKEKAIKLIKNAIEQKSVFAVAALAAFDLYTNLTTTDKDLEKTALDLIRSRPSILLEENCCSLLDKIRMETILADKNMCTDEYTMFQIMLAWSKIRLCPSEYRPIAASMTQHIALELIDPTILCNHVRKSGLITDTQILDAVAIQAPQAKTSLSFPKRTDKPVAVGTRKLVWVQFPQAKTGLSIPVWRKSQSDLYQQASGSWNSDVVVGRIMKSGVHKWKVRIEEDTRNNFFFGVASAGIDIPAGEYLGKTNGSWGARLSSGNKYWQGQTGTIPKKFNLSIGSIVELVLTLSDENGNRLEAAVDGGKFVTVFEGSEIEDDGSGFVPAVGLYGASSIRFLGFD